MQVPDVIMWDGRKLNRDLFIRAGKDNVLILVQINVSKKEVAKVDLSRLRIMLSSIADIGALARQSLLLCFDGWDLDQRPLAEIPEVVRYIKRIVTAYPYIWYYLLPECNQHVFVGICACTLITSPLFPQIKLSPDLPPSGNTSVQLDVAAANKQIASMTDAVTEYAQSIGDQRGAREVLRRWCETLNL